MAIIGPIVSNDWFFFVTIFALAALMVLFDAKRRRQLQLDPLASPAANAARLLGRRGVSGCGWDLSMCFRSCSSPW
jgi:hypothetical protein